MDVSRINTTLSTFTVMLLLVLNLQGAVEGSEWESRVNAGLVTLKSG